MLKCAESGTFLQEHEYAIESTANVAGVPEPVYIKKYIKYQSDSYK